jgi:uncharacterized membrane protein
MSKHDFLVILRDRLGGLPEKDIRDSLDYYSSTIDDLVESGKSEDEAVRALGTIDEVVRAIKSDRPLKEVVKASVASSHWSTGNTTLNIVLLVLGFPLWFPLLLTALILVFVAYLLVWLAPLITWIVAVSCAFGGFWSLIEAAIGVVVYGPLQGFAAAGAGLMAIGLGLFAGIGAYYLTRYFVGVSAKLGRGLKGLFVR